MFEIIFYNKKRQVSITLDIKIMDEIQSICETLFYFDRKKQTGYTYRNDKIIKLEDPSYAEIWVTENQIMEFVCRRYFRFRQLTSIIGFDQMNDPFLKQQQIAVKPLLNWKKIQRDSFFGNINKSVTLRQLLASNC